MNTNDFSKQVKDLRKNLVDAISAEVQNTKSGKIKFTETEAPRFYFDGGWRDIIQVSQGFMNTGDCRFGWHDDRCANKGANAFVYSAQLSVDLLLQIYELIQSKKK